MNKKLIWGIIIAVVIVVGIVLFVNNKEKSQPVVNNAVDVTDWKTYTNNEYGFEVKIPNTGTAVVEKYYPVQGTNHTLGDAGFPIADGEIGTLGIMIFKNTSAASLEEELKSNVEYWNAGNVSHISDASYEKMVINSLPAWQVKERIYDNPVRQVEVYFLNQNNSFWLKYQENDEIGKKIISTFKFTNQVK